MAKYNVTHTCGHTEDHDICGTNVHGERERKAAWYATTLCSDCYKASKDAEAAKGTEEITMKYGEYKNKYANCATKSGSYNAKSKTITVFVPAPKEINEDEQIIEEMIEAGAPEVSAKQVISKSSASLRANIESAVTQFKAAGAWNTDNEKKFGTLVKMADILEAHHR